MRRALRLLATLATLTILPVVTASADAPAQEGVLRISLQNLGLTDEALVASDSPTQSVRFRARADQVLTRATLTLALRRSVLVPDLTSVEVLLNGEPAGSIDAQALGDSASEHRLAFDADALASENTLALRIHRASDESGCAHLPVGAWTAVQGGDLQLESMALSLPDDLAQLPLPFFDPEFDRQQTLHFVLPSQVSEPSLRAAAVVASWFALQGRGSLSFDVALRALPMHDAVVLVESAAQAEAYGLAAPAHAPALSLVPHPQSPRHKLLVVRGDSPAGLLEAAYHLLEHGTALRGSEVLAEAPSAAVTKDAPGVPRWVTKGNAVLGALPETQELRLAGGHSGTIRVTFRLPPDTFLWPNDAAPLDLGVVQGASEQRGLANLYVVWNGLSLGALPSTGRGRTRLRVPRESLRGWNELLVHASYREAADGECNSEDDESAFVELTKDSQLVLAGARRFTMMPNVNLFLYDGYPFTTRGDLGASLLVLPERPDGHEVAAALDALAHFVSITGHAPTHVKMVLGTPSPEELRGRDVLLVAGRGHHPLLDTWADRMPLHFEGEATAIERVGSATWYERMRTMSTEESELARARRITDGKQLGAVIGISSPEGAKRSVVIITGTSSALLPHMSRIQGYARGEAPENDLLVVTDAGRFLFQLGRQAARGELPPLLEARFRFAYDWPILLLGTFGAAFVLATWAALFLASRARRRLRRGET